jgi:uncharacterized delta-60 repeat protein
VVLQPDGKVLAGGYGGYPSTCVVLRTHADGTLDSSFGDGGFASVAPGACDSVGGIGLLPDGRIAVAATAYDVEGRFCLAGLLPDGRADPTFGEGGRTLTAFPGRLGVLAVGLALGPGPRIVVAGTANGVDILARYFVDGRLDVGFGQGGRVITVQRNPGGTFVSCLLRGVAVQPDGKVVTVGYLGSQYSGLVVTRYTGAGGLDPSFGSGGVLRPSPGSDPTYYSIQGGAMTIPGPGAILLGGWSGRSFDGQLLRTHTLLRLSAVTPVELTRFFAE